MLNQLIEKLKKQKNNNKNNKGDEKMNLAEYLAGEGKTFSKGLPDGDTFIEFQNTTIEETEFKDKKTDEIKKKWILNTKDSSYIVGIKVMRGLNEALEAGFPKARITRTGTGIDTQYTVKGIRETAEAE